MDTLIAVPIQRRPVVGATEPFCSSWHGPGAWVSESTGVNANDLQLERPHPQVLLRAKGRRDPRRPPLLRTSSER